MAIIILSKFTPLYPKLSEKLHQAQDVLHLFNMLIITLAVGFFTLEIFQSSIAFALFVATIFAFVYLWLNVFAKKTISPKMNAILKGFLLVGHGILCLPAIISAGIWQFSSLDPFIQFILINASLFYGILCLERTGYILRVNNITGEKFQEIFRFILMQTTFITLYAISSGLLGLITSIPTVNEFFKNSNATILFYTLFPSILLYGALKIITMKQRFNIFERMLLYLKVESLIVWNIFVISQLFALILLFPGFHALYIGCWMIFNFAQIITVKELGIIHVKIAPRVKFVIDLLIMINSLLVTVGFYLLLTQMFGIGVNVSIICAFALSNIVFGNIRQFTRYFMKYVFVGIKLLLLNGFFISLHIYFINYLNQFGFLNSIPILFFYAIPISLLYYLPLLKHDLSKIRELNLISQKNWHLSHYILLNIQYITLCLTLIFLILREPLLEGDYTFFTMGIILLVISACMVILDILFLWGSHNRKFKEYTIFQKLFLYQFHFFTYTTLTLASIGIVFLTNMRLDIVFGLFSVNGVILIHKLKRILAMSPSLSEILQMGIIFLKRILVCLIATSILVVLHLDFGWRILTSMIIVLTLLAPVILFIPYFKEFIPEKIKWQFWALYLFISGMLGFESLVYVNIYYDSQAFIPILLILIFLPLGTINYSIKLLEKGGLASKVAFHLKQAIFILFLGDICAISYLSLHSFVNPYFYLLIISVILPGIITFDYYHDKLLTGSKLLLITELTQFFLISTGFTLFLTDLLTNSLEKQIFGGIVFGLLFLKGAISQTERMYERWMDIKMSENSDSESEALKKVENDLNLTQEDLSRESVVSGDLLDNDKDRVSNAFDVFTASDTLKAPSETNFVEIPAGFPVIEFLHQKYLGFQRFLIISVGILIGYFWIRLGTMNIIEFDFNSLYLIIAILGLTLSYTLKEIMGSEPNFWKSSLILGLNIAFYFSFSYISTQWQVISVISCALILGILQKGITHRYPKNPLQSYLENLFFLFLYGNIFFTLSELDPSVQILFTTTSFILFSRSKYLDLFFVSVFVVSLSNFMITLLLFLKISLYSSIGISFFVGILGEWILCGFSTRWQNSRLKKILGFSSYGFGIVTFAFVSYDYYSLLQYIIPVVLAISIVMMIFLQKQEMLSHRKPVYLGLIFVILSFSIYLLVFVICSTPWNLD